MKETVVNRILEGKLIVIVRGITGEVLIPFAEAVYEGGVRALELTYDAKNPGRNEEIAGNIRMLQEHFEDRMLIGAGTVLSEEQVEWTAQAGGSFVISPDTNPAIIRKTGQLGLVSIPGALTPTEAVQAQRAGADFVKLFPVSSMGSRYLKALTAPLSHIRFLAVGGVTAGNMKEYLAAGACGFGIGSDIANHGLIDAGNFGAITDRARKYMDQLL